MPSTNRTGVLQKKGTSVVRNSAKTHRNPLTPALGTISNAGTAGTPGHMERNCPIQSRPESEVVDGHISGRCAQRAGSGPTFLT